MVDTQHSRLTQALRTGISADNPHRMLMPGLLPGANYSYPQLGNQPRYDYSRAGNPTCDLLSDAIATLEGGAAGVVTASGLGAITAVIMDVCPTPGRIIAGHDCYGGTVRLLTQLENRGVCTTDYVDQGDLDALAQACSTPFNAVLVETPSNPLLHIIDIEKAAQIAHENGGLCIVDNTFCSPVRQQPLSLGADIVVHSTTKFINGHSDVIGGAIVAQTQERRDSIQFIANALGLTAAAWDSWMILRGMRTLDARIRVHDENAAAVVKVLTSHKAVRRVYYPGLESHPGHMIALKQQSSFGSVISFELDNREQAQRFVDALQIFDLAESLGGIESLVSHSATMTHASLTPEQQAQAGITEGLLRLSVGIEQADDLANDIAQALDTLL